MMCRKVWSLDCNKQRQTNKQTDYMICSLPLGGRIIQSLIQRPASNWRFIQCIRKSLLFHPQYRWVRIYIHIFLQSELWSDPRFSKACLFLHLYSCYLKLLHYMWHTVQRWWRNAEYIVMPNVSPAAALLRKTNIQHLKHKNLKMHRYINQQFFMCSVCEYECEREKVCVCMCFCQKMYIKEFRWGPSNIRTNFLICSLNVKVEIWDTKTFHKNKIKQMGYGAGSSRALQHFLQLRLRHMSQLLTLHSIKTNFVFSSWEHLEVWGKGLGFKKHDNSRFHSYLFTTTLILWCLVTIITGRNPVSPYEQELGRKIKNSQSEKQQL